MISTEKSSVHTASTFWAPPPPLTLLLSKALASSLHAWHKTTFVEAAITEAAMANTRYVRYVITRRAPWFYALLTYIPMRVNLNSEIWLGCDYSCSAHKSMMLAVPDPFPNIWGWGHATPDYSTTLLHGASSSFGTNQQGDVLKSCLHGLIRIFEAPDVRKRKNVTYAHASAIVCAR